MRIKKILAAVLTAGLLFGSACTPGGQGESPAQSSDSAPAQSSPGGESELKKEREDRDLESYILPANEIDEESLPDAPEGSAEAYEGGYRLKGAEFTLALEESGALAVVGDRGRAAVAAQPVSLYVRGEGQLSAAYSAVSVERYGLKAVASVSTPNGSVFAVEDRYYFPEEEGGDAFNVRRSVYVEQEGDDGGFESVFRMSVPSGGVGEYAWFVPNNVFGEFPKNGNSYAASKILRETMLGLPYAMYRSEETGVAFSLARYQPAVTSTGNSYASFALLNEDGESPCIEIAYPSRDTARRYFDVEQGARIVYDLTLRAENTESYPAATASVYNAHFALQDQRIVNTDIDEVYAVINEDFKTFLLSTSARGDTSYGLPWRVTIENGKIGPKSYQAGFVGQQIPAAYHMLYYGILNDDAESFRNGMNVLDFWVDAGMMTEAGIPRIWYNGDNNTFNYYPTFLRMAVDAMEGLLDGYRLLYAHGLERESWYRSVVAFADFLVREQNKDGSWYRCYNWDGGMFRAGDNGIPEPGGNICQSSSKANTTMPVRFLGKMYELTGREEYRTAALAAGEYIYEELYPLGYYQGGTCDNPNAQDKEAGVFAMYCYDALYMLSKNEKWIDCLRQATAFTMSSVLAYSFDVMESASDLKAAYPLKHGYTDGLSFITCGGTGVDNFIAFLYYELFRIYIITGEESYLRQAEFIQQNTKSTMDWDGALGYPYRSLVAEATTITGFGFNSATDDDGVMGVWLPWASVANAEPIAKMYDGFGSADVMDYADVPLEELRAALDKIGVGGNAHRKYVTSVVRSYAA